MAQALKPRNIAVLTGSRGEWGYIRPILKLIDESPYLDYTLIVTHMHLLNEFGRSVNEIEKDGFTVHERIHMTFDGYSAPTMTKSLAVLLMELPTVFERLKPDFLLISGDRGEQLMGAIAAGHMAIPVAHVQAGELSGNIDGIVRHSITKLAHVHFAANQEFHDRVEKMGEQKFRIHITGAPLVDEIVSEAFTSEDDLRLRFPIKDGPLILAVQHPVTEEEEHAEEHFQMTLDILEEKKMNTVFIYPNADAGSHAVRNRIKNHTSGHIKFFRNLQRQDYLGFMRMAKAMIGNSSSGIMEAPSFGTPVVNIGRRQKGRLHAKNVINVDYDKAAITAALDRALSDEHQKLSKTSENPYGDGKASQRIVDILRDTPIDEKLLNKEMTY